MQTLIDLIASLLRIPGDFLRELVIAIPLGVARMLFLLYFALLIFWVLTRPKSDVQGTLPISKKQIDLRPYAIVALSGQIIIYLMF